jgi:hypothetical protein
MTQVAGGDAAVVTLTRTCESAGRLVTSEAIARAKPSERGE